MLIVDFTLKKSALISDKENIDDDILTKPTSGLQSGEWYCVHELQETEKILFNNKQLVIWFMASKEIVDIKASF